MPRIPDDELTRLKAIPLLELCREYGIELTHEGKDWKGRCPFHEDSSPSFVVSPGKNLWNCLGACGCGGDTLQLVMKKDGVSFRHACEKLRTRLGGVPPPAVVTTRVGTSHDILAAPEEAANDAALLGKVADFYHRAFLNEPAAMKYLQSRACLHPEAAAYFKLGYANRTLGYRVPDTTAEGRELKARLQRLGVLRPKTGHEHLNGCVVFPIEDTSGKPVQLYGRRLTEAANPRHLYLSGPQRGVWNHAGLLPGAEWFLGEALIDALTLWTHGWRSVTASYGVNGWTSEHAALVAERRPERVVICYDGDAAGNARAAALASELSTLGVAVWRAGLPEGKDLNNVACEASDPAAALRAVIDGAQKVAGAVVVPVTKPEASPSPDASRAPASSLAAVAAKKEAAAALPGDAVTVVKADADEVVLACGARTYRVRGLYRNSGYETLKVSLRVACAEAWHLDSLDLAQARQRAAFVQAAAEETGLAPDLLRRDVGRVLLKLEELQEERLRGEVKPQGPAAPKMTPAEQRAALEFLRSPKLLDRILADFAACGVVGEETNKLIGYLAAVSRKLPQPLAIVVQSTSAAGKTALMEAVLAFIPPEERIKYSALTGQALFYLSETNLKHKILAIVEEEGAERASYALKLLQSEGELTIAATGKDPATGRMTTQEYRVEGPVMIFLTTTAVDIDEELLNRCLVLTVDEGREQTAAIHRLQRERETLSGLLRSESRHQILNTHRNAQRLLRPLRVVNPYAEKLTFLDDRTRTRRDHTKYLALIRTIALLHQYQRPVKTAEHEGKTVEYIEATLEDIAAANRLAHHVLGRCLDEMPPQTRRLLELIERMVGERCAAEKVQREDVRFRARELREYTGWGNSQLHLHLRRLAEMEYVLTHRADHGQGFVYELVYDGGGKDGGRFLPGLLDVESLRRGGSTATPRDAGASPGAGVGPCHPGVKGDHPAPVRPVSGPVPGPVRAEKVAPFSSEKSAPDGQSAQNAHQAGDASAA
ncbi:CHC2 zinc finger domain-containing protein [Nibricoccus sp. IMCC34717]|uniref:CHC2 zinc finger domain-containing protein n=1 Tax=Nibricoccus sp. IMCC34717 TaxID=3034021 RepID=UPI00384D1E84